MVRGFMLILTIEVNHRSCGRGQSLTGGKSTHTSMVKTNIWQPASELPTGLEGWQSDMGGEAGPLSAAIEFYP